jgi:hypothetical protein
MIVYHHGSPDKPPVETHTLIVCPAKHLPSHCPEDFWWDNTGETKRALEFQVTFHYGEAEVEDQLGRYLVATGMAKDTRYIPSTVWMPHRASLQG